MQREFDQSISLYYAGRKDDAGNSCVKVLMSGDERFFRLSLSNLKFYTPILSGSTDENRVCVPYRDDLCMVWNWHPLRIVSHHDYSVVAEVETPPYLRHAVGSTDACVLDDELWLIVHFTDGKIRYHAFVVLDRLSLCVLRCSFPLKFEDAEEHFCTALVVDHDCVRTTYYTTGGCRKLRVSKKSDVEEIMAAFTKTNEGWTCSTVDCTVRKNDADVWRLYPATTCHGECIYVNDVAKTGVLNREAARSAKCMAYTHDGTMFSHQYSLRAGPDDAHVWVRVDAGNVFDTAVFEKTQTVQKINKIVASIGEPLEGNCMYQHNQMYVIREDAENIRQNIFKICKGSRNIIEVGFNGGHSCALYFHANSKIRVVSFDICLHRYTEKVAAYLKSRNDITLVKGDSRVEIPRYNTGETFDVIHIDGGHGTECATADLMNCAKFAHKDSLLIFDDSNFDDIHTLLETHIAKNLIEEIDYCQYRLEKSNLHRIFKYC